MWLRNVFLILFLLGFVSAEQAPQGTPYNIGLVDTAANIAATLNVLAPYISLSLIILSGIVYGLSYMQPPDARGKWQTTALGLFIGGIIIAAITMAAGAIQKGSETLLTS